MEWGAQVDKLLAFRGVVNGLLVESANLHLRLMGLDMVARADTEPLRSMDALKDAQARKQDIENELALVDRGMRSPEDASMTLTGTGVFDESRVYGTAPAPAPAG